MRKMDPFQLIISPSQRVYVWKKDMLELAQSFEALFQVFLCLFVLFVRVFLAHTPKAIDPRAEIHFHGGAPKQLF